MKDPNAFHIPDVGKGYGKGLKSLLLIYWVLAAIAGTALAIGHGIFTNDWIVFASSFGPRTQSVGWWIAHGAAAVAVVILCLYGLLAIFKKRQWLLLFPCLAAVASFPALLYVAPHWAPFAFGGGALALGVLALMYGERSDKKRALAAQKASTKK